MYRRPQSRQAMEAAERGNAAMVSEGHAYLESLGIASVFQELTAALVMYQPHDPFVFLSDAFEHIAAVSSAKEAAMDRHISSPSVRRSVGSRIGGGSGSGTVQPGLLTDFATAYFEEDRVGTAQRSGRVSALLPASSTREGRGRRSRSAAAGRFRPQTAPLTSASSAGSGLRVRKAAVRPGSAYPMRPADLESGRARWNGTSGQGRNLTAAAAHEDRYLAGRSGRDDGDRDDDDDDDYLPGDYDDYEDVDLASFDVSRLDGSTSTIQYADLSRTPRGIDADLQAVVGDVDDVYGFEFDHESARNTAAMHASSPFDMDAARRRYRSAGH